MTGNDQIIVNQCCGQLVNCSNESFVSANELIEHFEKIFIVTIAEIYNAIHGKYLFLALFSPTSTSSKMFVNLKSFEFKVGKFALFNTIKICLNTLHFSTLLIYVL
jgi:hypothetical protein